MDTLLYGSEEKALAVSNINNNKLKGRSCFLKTKAILVFIDGTICDTRHRNDLFGTDAFSLDENILKDAPTDGSVEFLNSLADRYSIVYIGARPEGVMDITKQWLEISFRGRHRRSVG